jgi:hypothetical protein
MILQNHIIKLLQQLLALIRIKLINILRECADGIDTLPTSHGIRTDHWVDGGQLFTDVLRAPAWFLIDPDFLWVRRGGFDEAISDEGCSQAFEELLVRLRKAIVDFVARGPQGIAAGGGKLR